MGRQSVRLMMAKRLKVEKLVLDMHGPEEIAEKMGASRATIYNDLASIDQGWRERFTENIAEIKARKLASLDHLEGMLLDRIHGSNNHQFPTLVDRLIRIKYRRGR